MLLALCCRVKDPIETLNLGIDQTLPAFPAFPAFPAVAALVSVVMGLNTFCIKNKEARRQVTSTAYSVQTILVSG